MVHASEPPNDWSNNEAYERSLDAETASAAGQWERCVEADIASLSLEDRAATRLHMAGCAERAGRVFLGLQQLQVVLDAAIASRDQALAAFTEGRVSQLLRKLSALTVETSKEAKELTVTIDDVPVAADQLGKGVSVDPGKHLIHADGLIEGAAATFDEVVTLGEGEHATAVVMLRPRASEFLTPGQLACMQLSKTQLEVLQCLPGAAKPLVVRAALEASTYVDTFSVLILNPAVRVSAASPTKGWHVGASYLLDVISAASPDFVSTASPRGHDTRHAATVNGGYKPERLGVEASAGYSSEADYVSRTASVAILGDILDKQVTPRLGYTHSWDTIGRGGTPTSVFSNTLHANEATASVSIVASPKTLLVAGGSLMFERGDQSKPYRLIPLFASGVEVRKGASPDEVNAARLPVRPYEQLPLERNRYALGARMMHRFKRSTLRFEERLYTDTWENRGVTTDARWLVDIEPRFTVGPHARFTAQTGANFHQRVYHATTEPLIVPTFRTTDRELAPLWALTGGASMWWNLPMDQAAVHLTLYMSADLLWSHYPNSIYVKERTAGYGTVGVEAEFN